ncbi:hypothetical protein T07_768 [Trichinella nelsoni]|uniref:Uncharacterized protein n=1 Tax=Trichinella nelsoni TaxID=6336 RepID=A0A0V0SLN7_9BILA|nr:hypothetical protein T07_768 [Trichinella nelsoni]
MKLQPAAGQNRRETLQKQNTRSGPGMLNNWPNKLASFDVDNAPNGCCCATCPCAGCSRRWMAATQNFSRLRPRLQLKNA